MRGDIDTGTTCIFVDRASGNLPINHVQQFSQLSAGLFLLPLL